MTDEELLRNIAGGGRAREAGLKGLFDRYAPRIKNFLRGKGCKDEDASDLLQDIFIRVMRAADSFRFDAKVSTWIWSIAHNSLIDHWRARHPTESIDEILEGDSDEGEATLGQTEPEHEVAAMKDCVRMALTQFAEKFPDSAHAIRLSAVEGWSMEELSQALGRTLGATREFVSQCRKKLRPFIEHCRELLPT